MVRQIKLNRKLKYLLISLLILALLPLIFWKQIAIRYHDYQHSILITGFIYSGELPSHNIINKGQSLLFNEIKYHLDQLVKLEYLKTRKFKYQNIMFGSPECSHLLSTIDNQNSIFYESIAYGSNKKKNPPVTIEIWYRPNHHNDLIEFFKKTDIPD